MRSIRVLKTANDVLLLKAFTFVPEFLVIWLPLKVEEELLYARYGYLERICFHSWDCPMLACCRFSKRERRVHSLLSKPMLRTARLTFPEKTAFFGRLPAPSHQTAPALFLCIFPQHHVYTLRLKCLKSLVMIENVMLRLTPWRSPFEASES
jgi:hypothetical protein